MLTLPRAHNIVGRWCPSAGATGFRLLDRSGRSNHGTLTGMDPATDWVASGGKGALDFDGSNDYVVSQSNFIHETLTTDVLISFWMKLNSTGVQQSVFGSDSSSSATQRMQAHCPWSDNVIYWDFGNFGGGNRLATSALTWSTSVWYHVAVYAGTQGMRIFRNGLSQATSSVAVSRTSLASPFRIGSSATTEGTWFFPGQIDDFVVYNVPLTANEVAQIYRSGRGFGVFPEVDFDEGFAAGGFKGYWATRQHLIGSGVY